LLKSYIAWQANPYYIKEKWTMAEKTVAVPEAQEERAVQPEETRTRERYVAPPVDIYEVADGLVVTADVPGVTQDQIEVRVDNHILTIRSQASEHTVADPSYREYGLVSYFRQFELSDKVDEGKITADLKHGVLTLTLPKAEEAKPRKISVSVG
jgi:HSP20 family molecular chaperone IbpA